MSYNANIMLRCFTSKHIVFIKLVKCLKIYKHVFVISKVRLLLNIHSISLYSIYSLNVSIVQLIKQLECSRFSFDLNSFCTQYIVMYCNKYWFSDYHIFAVKTKYLYGKGRQSHAGKFIVIKNQIVGYHLIFSRVFQNSIL